MTILRDKKIFVNVEETRGIYARRSSSRVIVRDKQHFYMLAAVPSYSEGEGGWLVDVRPATEEEIEEYQLEML